jgi:hypothetical protein
MPSIKNLIVSEKYQYLLEISGTKANHVPIYLREYIDRYPLALDKVHPGVECHKVYAEEICRLI